MILLVILVGLYLIVTVGYFKFAKRTAEANELLAEYLVEYPRSSNTVLAAMSLVWWAWIVGFLVKQAV